MGECLREKEGPKCVKMATHEQERTRVKDTMNKMEQRAAKETGE